MPPRRRSRLDRVCLRRAAAVRAVPGACVVRDGGVRWCFVAALVVVVVLCCLTCGVALWCSGSSSACGYAMRGVLTERRSQRLPHLLRERQEEGEGRRPRRRARTVRPRRALFVPAPPADRVQVAREPGPARRRARHVHQADVLRAPQRRPRRPLTRRPQRRLHVHVRGRRNKRGAGEEGREEEAAQVAPQCAPLPPFRARVRMRRGVLTTVC